MTGRLMGGYLKGGGLNYEIIAVANESALPASPKENTIAVFTTTPIGEHQFSVSTPIAKRDGTALATGDIWINTNNASNIKFNALSENVLMTYPYGVYQYISNAWQSISNVKIYQNGQWISFITWFYNQGNLYASLTGGWEHSFTSGFSDTYQLILGPSSMNRTISGSSTYVYRTTDAINVTPFKKIFMNASYTSNYSGIHRITIFTSTSATPASTTAAFVRDTNFSTQTVDFDVSAVTGNQFLTVAIYHNYHASPSGSSTCAINQIWAE